MAVCQNPVPLVNIKIAGKWMFISLKMVWVGIDPYPYDPKLFIWHYFIYDPKWFMIFIIHHYYISPVIYIMCVIIIALLVVGNQLAAVSPNWLSFFGAGKRDVPLPRWHRKANWHTKGLVNIEKMEVLMGKPWENHRKTIGKWRFTLW